MEGEVFEFLGTGGHTFDGYIPPAGGGSGNGKYGVRPFWTESTETDEEPMLDFLAFGTEADLDTWDGDKFTCNYDESGTLLDNPPVKIVRTDTCKYNMFDE